MTASALEKEFELHLRAHKITGAEQEYRFDGIRKWRVDFAWPEKMLAVELEGGIWTNGRHTRGAGFQADCIKYNALAIRGWRLLRFTAAMVKSGEAIEALKACLETPI